MLMLFLGVGEFRPTYKHSADACRRQVWGVWVVCAVIADAQLLAGHFKVTTFSALTA